MPSEPCADANEPASTPVPSEYDTRALLVRAEQWRAEAASVTLEAMRAFCLDEAERHEQRLQRSLSTPVFHGWGHTESDV
jgi:hypothetical protein